MVDGGGHGGGREVQGRKVEDGGGEWWRMGEGRGWGCEVDNGGKVEDERVEDGGRWRGGWGKVEDGGEVNNGGKVEDERLKDGGRWGEVEVHLKESQLTT